MHSMPTRLKRGALQPSSALFMLGEFRDRHRDCPCLGRFGLSTGGESGKILNFRKDKSEFTRRNLTYDIVPTLMPKGNPGITGSLWAGPVVAFQRCLGASIGVWPWKATTS